MYKPVVATMKKLLLTTAFALVTLGAYAQSQDMIEDWERAKACAKAYLDAKISGLPTPNS